MDDIGVGVVIELFARTQGRPASVAILLAQRFQFVPYDRPALAFTTQQPAQLLGAGFFLPAFGLNFFDFQAGELVEANIENGVGLDLGQLKTLLEFFPRVLAGGRIPDEADDGVELVGNEGQTGKNMQAGFQLV